MTRQSPAPLEHRSLTAVARTMRELVRQVEDGLLDLNPPYQRSSVWTIEQRMNLVKSWLLGLTVPAIIVNDRSSNPDWAKANGPLSDDAPYYALIDGKQRVETGIAWFTDQLAVPASWFPPDWVNVTEDTDDGPYVRFSGLTARGQAKMRTLAAQPQLVTHVATEADEARLYLLINNAGTSQTPADLARATAIAHGQATPEPGPTASRPPIPYENSGPNLQVDVTTVNGQRWLNEADLARALRHAVTIPDGYPLGPSIDQVFGAMSAMITGRGTSATVVLDALNQLIQDAQNLRPPQ